MNYDPFFSMALIVSGVIIPVVALAFLCGLVFWIFERVGEWLDIKARDSHTLSLMRENARVKNDNEELRNACDALRALNKELRAEIKAIKRIPD